MINTMANIFRKLAIPDFFGGNYDTDDYENIFQWCQTNRDKIKSSYQLKHGVSKLVFLFEDMKDWVVKIPFNGYYYSSNYTKEDEEWIDFINASDDYYGEWDYCNTELEYYEKMKENDLECFLANTQYLCSTLNYYPIYIQEKVTPQKEDTKKRTPSQKSLNLVNEKRYHVNRIWAATAIDFYGIEKTEKFIDYIENIYPRMGYDLHDGNYGYRADGSPCLIDFSGWEED